MLSYQLLINSPGVEVKFKNFLYPVLILPNQVPDLTDVQMTESGIRVGAAATLSTLQASLSQYITKLPGITVLITFFINTFSIYSSLILSNRISSM